MCVPADQVVPCGDTDDTDAVSRSMNSTVESFSENAWDNYQASPYACISSDPGEEKLDPSHLQADWDHNLEYEEDFGYDQSFGAQAICCAEGKATRTHTKEKRTSVSVIGISLYVVGNLIMISCMVA